ncbi:ABC transporter substrate-binding protein [Microbacterium sp. A93]|uniref:ABC transporter substrate-binding protein n=1 Tax=Microbacterium sp. A93 TaxID=3450716 RepID=UPI003F437AF5
MTSSWRPLAAAAFAVVLTVGMSACASGDSGGSRPGGEESVLRWSLGLPTSWDPVTSRTGFDINTISLPYASLTRLDDKGNVEPSLAESWTYDETGTSITFTLRDNLTFSDGTPLDAEAVKAHFERGQDQADSHLRDQLADLESVTADSETEVTLHLTTVDYQIPYLVAGRTGAIASPTAAEDPKHLAIAPVGAGPFILTEFVAESHASFIKNDDYWDADNIHIDRFELSTALDAATVVSAVQSGSIDVARLPATQIEQAASAGLTVTVAGTLAASDASINLNKAPLDDPAVVEALRYAFDREAFVDAVTAGTGTVTHQPFPEGYVAFNPEIEDIWSYDPDKARQILSDAGYEDGDLAIEITAHAGSELDAQLTQSQLADIGINSTISLVPAGSTTWQDEVYVAKSPQLALDGTIGRESPVANLLATYGPEGIMNLSGPHSSDEFLAALDAVRATPIDAPEYQENLWNAVRIGVEQSPTNYLYSSPWVFVSSSDVGELNLLPSQVRWEGVQVGD